MKYEFKMRKNNWPTEEYVSVHVDALTSDEAWGRFERLASALCLEYDNAIMVDMFKPGKKVKY